MTYQADYRHYRGLVDEDRLAPYWRDVSLPHLDRLCADRLPFNLRRQGLSGGFTSTSVDIALKEYGYLREHRQGWLDAVRHQQPLMTWDDRLAYDLDRSDLHHLYHLARWEQETGSRIGEVGMVVEWGGGWARMAELICRFNPRATYVLVDLPVMSFLQSHLLPRAMFDPETVRAGCLNLVPSVRPMLDKVHPPDLFISTWALSESSADDVDEVWERGWLDAEHLLLAHDISETAERFPETLCFLDRVTGGTVVPAAPDGSWYLFR